MKKIMLLLTLVFTAVAHGQIKEGRVVYERTFQLRVFTDNPDIAAQLPKSRTDQYELLFGDNQSLWQFLPDVNSETDPNTFTGSGMVLRFAGGSNDVSYYNLDKGTRVDQREIADKNFVVTDSIQKLDWKLTDETKTILNHKAFKATAHRIFTRNQMTMENGEMKRQLVTDTSNLVAWFTPDVAVSVGPGIYQGQLPGLILELDENNGQTVFKAIEMSPKVTMSKIKEPRDGKKLTAAEFEKERDKVMEEMRRNMPNGMQMRIQN